MVLKIDTTDRNKITVVIKENGKILDELIKEQEKGAQMLLPLIDEILKKNKKTLKDLSAIEVNPGPGSFTGTRVGVTVANSLGFALQIPVNGKKGKIVLPKYEKSKFDL